MNPKCNHHENVMCAVCAPTGMHLIPPPQAPAIPVTLTKREQFAAMAMQGILADSEINYADPAFMAIEAVSCADALLKALEADNA